MSEGQSIDEGSEQALAPEAFIIPTGYKLVRVEIDANPKIESSCSHCGGSTALLTAAACDYCASPRTHYAYQKEGQEMDQKLPTASQPQYTEGQVTVTRNTLEGTISADEVRVGIGSTVGKIDARDNVYFDADSQAGSIFSPIITVGERVRATEAATSVLDGSLTADYVTIFDGGRISGSTKNIRVLRLGNNVQAPESSSTSFSIRGLFTRNKTEPTRIIRGDFPVPTAWQK